MAKVRIDVAMVAQGLAESREQAQRLVTAGRVRSGTLTFVKASQMVAEDAELVVSEPERYVSRGGLKLEGALREFGIDVSGLRCLDLGASTGGFTDCLLQHGAASVLAVDVGRAQLHDKLRKDPRVVLLEGTNARALPELGTTNDERRATSDERRATSNEQRATSDEQRATSDERRATSDEQRATSDEQRATSDERRATSDEDGGSSNVERRRTVGESSNDERRRTVGEDAVVGPGRSGGLEAGRTTNDERRRTVGGSSNDDLRRALGEDAVVGPGWSGGLEAGRTTNDERRRTVGRTTNDERRRTLGEDAVVELGRSGGLEATGDSTEEESASFEVRRSSVGLPEFFVADLSFISLRKVLPSVASRLGPGTQGVVLLKPQFEAGPKDVPRGGVIKDAAVLERVRSEFVEWLGGAGWHLYGMIASPIRGGDGNTEYLAHVRTPV